MKVRVIFPFIDKYDSKKKYAVGDVLDVEDERAVDLTARSLAEVIDPPKPTRKRKVKATSDDN